MALLELILPIFAVIFLGFLLRKAGRVDEAFVQILNHVFHPRLDLDDWTVKWPLFV